MKRMILAAFLAVAVSALPALAADTSADRKEVASSAGEVRSQVGNTQPGAATQQCNCHVNG